MWLRIIYIILLIIGVWTISFSSKKKKRFTKEKVLARLGRLRLQGALAPANFILNLRFKMKKPCYFPVDFLNYRE